jgi:hypothetical protein
MKNPCFVLSILFAIIGLTMVQAADPAQLATIQSHHLNLSDEHEREKYVLDLLSLRSKLVTGNTEDWQAVDREIVRHPAPSDSNTEAFIKVRIGHWRSPRHDYFYRANGTWIMLPSPPCTTSGTWTIKGNQESETVAGTTTSYTIILLDAKNSVLASGDVIFIEKRLPDDAK